MLLAHVRVLSTGQPGGKMGNVLRIAGKETRKMEREIFIRKAASTTRDRALHKITFKTRARTRFIFHPFMLLFQLGLEEKLYIFKILLQALYLYSIIRLQLLSISAIAALVNVTNVYPARCCEIYEPSICSSRLHQRKAKRMPPA